VREWVAQCHGADTGLTAQCRIVAGMASQGGLAERRRDMILRRVRGTAWRRFVFDLGAYMCQNIKCSGQGSRCGSGEPMRASSEAESSLEGVSGPRARRSLTRGAVQPSSVAKSHPRGRPALERGGISPEGVTSPRARWSLARRGVQPSSEVEFYHCDVVSLERNGISPEGGWGWLFWWAVGAARSVGPCRWAVIVSGVFYVL
jgi:hypothetical protein